MTFEGARWRGGHLELNSRACRSGERAHRSMLQSLVCTWLRREQRLASASSSDLDLPAGQDPATKLDLYDRFKYFLRNQHDEDSFGLHNFH